MAYQGNGPRAGRTTGRARNTLRNNASKVPPPPVSPGSAVAYGNQMAQAHLNLGAKLAALRAQRGMIQGDFRMENANIRAEKLSGITNVVEGAIEGGILGGSAELQSRIGVESDAAAARAANIQNKVRGLLGLKMDRIQATNDYYTDVFNIQAAKAAERAELANQAFIQDMVMRLTSNPGGSRSDGRAGAGGAGSPFGGNAFPTDTNVGGNNFPYPQAPSGPYGPTDTSVGGNSFSLGSLRAALGLTGTAQVDTRRRWPGWVSSDGN